MNAKDRLNALEVALNNEMREREFYLNHANRTKNPLGKKMFQQIGDEELEHYEWLKQLHQKWTQQERWPETVPLKVKNTVVKDILAGFIKKVDETSKGDSDDLEAVRTALDFEAKGAKFYAEFRDSVSDPKEKQFFDLLAKIENEHYLSLKDTEEYLIDPALTNRMLSAQEALDWGLVNRVVPDTELLVQAKAIADQLAAGAPKALGAAKRLLHGNLTETLETQMEDESQTIAGMARTRDTREGITAFLEKRPPKFKGE